MSLPFLITLFLVLGALSVLALAFAFFQDPDGGLRLTTHRREQLPLVMIDRYAALGVIQIGLIFWGNLQMVAVFCIAAALMSFGDAQIYARAGHSARKHLLAGLFAVMGFALTLYFLWSM